MNAARQSRWPSPAWRWARRRARASRCSTSARCRWRPREVDFARAFARRETVDEEGETDYASLPIWAAAIGERRARAAQVLDACGFALDRLARIAERLSATLVLPVAATPWQAPSPREAGLLLDRFAGAPLGVVWDPGRLSALAALGLAISDERLAALAATAVLSLDNDAVGMQAGYLPGLGERDPRVAALRPPSGVARVIMGGPDATDAEVATAVAALASDRDPSRSGSERGRPAPWASRRQDAGQLLGDAGFDAFRKRRQQKSEIEIDVHARVFHGHARVQPLARHRQLLSLFQVQAAP